MFGLFESETITSVSTSVSRVIEDRLIPNSIKTGTIKGILGGGDQLVENIMEDMVASMGVKGERLYRYGKNGYIYGAPTSQIHRSGSVQPVLHRILQDQEGYPTTLDYAQYGPRNRLHFGWQTLFDSYGYNPQTNVLSGLSTLKGFPVYLEDMQVIFPSAKISLLTSTAFEQWGISPKAGQTPLRPYSLGSGVGHTSIGSDEQATQDFVRVTYIWRTSAGIQRETLDIPVPEAPVGAEYIQARYTYKVEAYRTYEDDHSGIGLPPIETIHYNYFTKFFTYQVGTGTQPDMDLIFAPEFNQLGSFFPFGYFRFNKQPTSTNPASAEYKAITKYMKCLNMDYAAVNEAINSNPQIEHVDSALLMLMVPASSGNALENRYLFDFFKRLYLQAVGAGGQSDGMNYISEPVMNVFRSLSKRVTAKVSLTIRDARFTTSLGMQGIFRKIRQGNIGKVGTHTSARIDKSVTHGVMVYPIDLMMNQREPYLDTWTTKEPTFIYCKQITPYLYEEIEVVGLRMTYEVLGGHSTTNEMVPIDHSITQDYSLPDREEIYARSLHYIINSVQETEVEWYQQEWFSTVLIIVAVVWTVFSMGSDGGSGLGAAMAAGTATLADIAVAVLIAAAWYVGIKVVTKLFVKMFGAEFALLFAVVVAAYGMYTQFGPGGLKGAPWAEQLLPLSNSLMTEASGSYAKDLQLLGEEADAFGLMAKAKTDELKKIQEELEGSRLLSPFVLFGEKPEEYFNRTVHSGNIGINSIDAISNYCDISLKLPTLEQTLSLEEV